MDNVLSILKNSGNEILDMILDRIEKYDSNKGKHSREPMFLTAHNTMLGWTRTELLSEELNIQKDDQIINLYEGGYLSEYVSKKQSKYDQYILGVFIERCFIPIFDEDGFKKIYVKLNK